MNSHKIGYPPQPDSDLTGWLSLIGFITMYWSPIERSIDQCVHIIYTRFDGGNLVGKKPAHLDQKFKFISDAHEKIPALKINQEYISKLISKTRPIANKRNIFVHGMIEEWSSDLLTISKIKKDDEYLKEMFTIDLMRLETLATGLSDLESHWHAVASHLSPKQI